MGCVKVSNIFSSDLGPQKYDHHFLGPADLNVIQVLPGHRGDVGFTIKSSKDHGKTIQSCHWDFCSEM